MLTVSRDILQCIFEFDTYSDIRYASANMVGNTLWVKAGNTNTLAGFEDYKIKVRDAISQMAKRRVILRNEGKPRFEITKSFIRRPSIYDEKTNIINCIAWRL